MEDAADPSTVINAFTTAGLSNTDADTLLLAFGGLRRVARAVPEEITVATPLDRATAEYVSDLLKGKPVVAPGAFE